MIDTTRFKDTYTATLESLLDAVENGDIKCNLADFPDDKEFEVVYDNYLMTGVAGLSDLKKDIKIDEDEKKSVDNFTIDFNTLETRIKYFSPTYLNSKPLAIIIMSKNTGIGSIIPWKFWFYTVFVEY